MKKNILITGTGGRSVGSGILHSLLRNTPEVSERWNLIAADADSYSWGLYKVQQNTLLPFANSPDYINTLNEVIAEFKIDAVVPGTQNEIEVMMENESSINAPIISNRKELIPLMMDKFSMDRTLREFNYPAIETVPFENWKTLTNKVGFPVIVKPTIGTGGSRGLHIIADEEEMEQLSLQIDLTTKPCVQQFIGTAEDEYTVGVLSDFDGEIIDSIVMKRKLIGLSLLNSRKINGKTYAISTGYSQGYIIKHKLIQDFCEELAKKIGSVGPLNIQLRLEGDKVYVFELHPRFSGTTPIRADVGFNEVDILLRNKLFNEKFKRLNYQYDVAAIRAFEHVIVPISKMIE